MVVSARKVMTQLNQLPGLVLHNSAIHRKWSTKISAVCPVEDRKIIFATRFYIKPLGLLIKSKAIPTVT